MIAIPSASATESFRGRQFRRKEESALSIDGHRNPDARFPFVFLSNLRAAGKVVQLQRAPDWIVSIAQSTQLLWLKLHRCERRLLRQSCFYKFDAVSRLAFFFIPLEKPTDRCSFVPNISDRGCAETAEQITITARKHSSSNRASCSVTYHGKKPGRQARNIGEAPAARIGMAQRGQQFSVLRVQLSRRHEFQIHAMLHLVELAGTGNLSRQHPSEQTIAFYPDISIAPLSLRPEHP